MIISNHDVYIAILQAERTHLKKDYFILLSNLDHRKLFIYKLLIVFNLFKLKMSFEDSDDEAEKKVDLPPYKIRFTDFPREA